MLYEVITPIGALAFQWHTKVKYVTKAPMAYLFAVLVIDRQAFARLSPADQDVVREVMERVYRNFNTQNRAEEKAAIETLKKQGLTFVEPQPGEIQLMRERSERVLRQLSDKGAFSPELYQKILRNNFV